MKKINFVFIDESITPEADLASLTCIIIPIDKYDKIRSEYYKIIKFILEEILCLPSDRIQIASPLTLHANDFLRNSNNNENSRYDFSNVTDKQRIVVLKKIIYLINLFKIKIVRVGYNNWKTIEKLNMGHRNLYFFTWLAIAKYLNDNYTNEKFICVMDGTDDKKMIKEFSNIILYPTILREFSSVVNESVMINNSDIFLGNVFYTPSKYSEFIQVVDIISYLLQKRDTNIICKIKEKFSLEIVKVIEKINKENLINEIKTLKYGK